MDKSRAQNLIAFFGYENLVLRISRIQYTEPYRLYTHCSISVFEFVYECISLYFDDRLKQSTPPTKSCFFFHNNHTETLKQNLTKSNLFDRYRSVSDKPYSSSTRRVRPPEPFPEYIKSSTLYVILYVQLPFCPYIPSRGQPPDLKQHEGPRRGVLYSRV